MFLKGFILAGKIYRANPLRPHCRADAGQHVWLCRLLNLPSAGTGYGMVGTAMMEPIRQRRS